MTPDFGEWIGRGSGKTWEQLGIMYDHMSVKTIAKNTARRIGHAAEETAQEIGHAVEEDVGKLHDTIKRLFE